MFGSAVAESPLAKALILLDVLPFHVEVGSLSNVSRSDKKLWTSDLRAVPAIDRSMIEDYLVNSPDKDYDGESLKSDKELRAYQLFEEPHTHSLELCPSLPTKNNNVQENPLCFVRCRCYPTQDTSKQPYRVVVCLDRRNGRPYGAHCRCFSGQGKACSHIAGLLFALEDFTSRGFQKLPDGQSTTDVLCQWNKPQGGQKVDARLLASVSFKKAVSGGRKEKTKWKRIFPISLFDPRHPKYSKVVMESVRRFAFGLKRQLHDCGFLRNWEDMQIRKLRKTHEKSYPSIQELPGRLCEEEERIVPMAKIAPGRFTPSCVNSHPGAQTTQSVAALV